MNLAKWVGPPNLTLQKKKKRDRRRRVSHSHIQIPNPSAERERERIRTAGVGSISHDWEPVVIRMKAVHVEEPVQRREREGKPVLISLLQLLEEREGPLISLEQLSEKREGTLISLKQLLEKREGPLISLDQLSERGTLISLDQLSEKRERIHKSQDWEPVVIRKKAPNAAAKKDEKAVNAARRAGADIETVKKSNAGTNRAASSSTSLNTRKLDEETENLHHKRVPTELKKAIIQARLDKNLTQAQLAQMINEKPQVIQEYESGKAIPNQQIIGKLERALGAKLRGKK